MRNRLSLWVTAAVALPISLNLSAQSGRVYGIGATFVRLAEGCPVFVLNMVPAGPADKGGLKLGDQLLAVGDAQVQDLPVGEIQQMLKSTRPGRIRVTVLRNRESRAVEIERADQAEIRQKQVASLASAGKKMIDGLIVPVDTSAAEMKAMAEFDGGRIVDRLFPQHYPEDPEIYYGGFEVFILRDPAQVMVGGIEEGPAAQAGVHWGDVIVSVDQVSLAGQGSADLVRLLTGTGPKMLHLRLDRLGIIKDAYFQLESAASVLSLNHRRIIHGKVVPDFVRDSDLVCAAQR